MDLTLRNFEVDEELMFDNTVLLRLFKINFRIFPWCARTMRHLLLLVFVRVMNKQKTSSNGRPTKYTVLLAY